MSQMLSKLLLLLEEEESAASASTTSAPADKGAQGADNDMAEVVDEKVDRGIAVSSAEDETTGVAEPVNPYEFTASSFTDEVPENAGGIASDDSCEEEMMSGV